jgi:hypothetical protein
MASWQAICVGESLPPGAFQLESEGAAVTYDDDVRDAGFDAEALEDRGLGA